MDRTVLTALRQQSLSAMTVSGLSTAKKPLTKQSVKMDKTDRTVLTALHQQSLSAMTVSGLSMA